MKNTDIFYQAIKDFRQGLEEINAKFDKEYTRLELFHDSVNYKSRKEEIDRRRGNQIAGIRQRAADSIQSALSSMERTYSSRPAVAPSDSQLRLLTALQMRESLSADEIRQAANALKDCPAATGVLRELAKKNHCSLDVQQELSGTEIQKGIESLRRRAETFLAKVDRLDDGAQRDRLNVQNRFD